MPSSIACAAVRPLNTVSTWSASTEAPYVAPNRKVTRSWNSVSRTAPKLHSVGQRLVAHLPRVGDLGSAGCGALGGGAVTRRRQHLTGSADQRLPGQRP